MPYKVIAHKYGIGKSAVTEIKKNRVQIEQALLTKSPRNKLATRKVIYQTIEQKTLQFFKEAREKKFPVSGSSLRTAATTFAEDDGDTEFCGSRGWLRKFQDRNKISFQLQDGEAARVNVESLNQWYSRLPEILRFYEHRNVWNADESGLFFKQLPRKSLVSDAEKAKGIKVVKYRVFVLLAGSAVGEKNPPLIIGKSKQPRGFTKHNVRAYDTTAIGFSYAKNSSAWMTTVIFEKWLDGLNDTLMIQGRTILLILDNCSSHNVMSRSNVDLLFLPPNVTSVAQPLDAGIIKSFKDGFRKQMFEDLRGKIKTIEDANEYVKQLTVYEASLWSVAADADMKKSVLVNCFAKCKISEKATEAGAEEPTDELEQSFDSMDFPDSVDCLDLSRLVEFDYEKDETDLSL